MNDYCEKIRHGTAGELIRRLEEIGWVLDRQKGSHAIFKHPARSGGIVVPVHPGDIPNGTLNDILKKSGLKK